MATHKHIDRICAAAAAITLLLTLLLIAVAHEIPYTSPAPGYVARLFDTSRVHQIDLVMDDWDTFLTTCEDETYHACAVVIDGESYKNVGIRAKGNTSLTQVRQMGSSRYSWKLEFDHYECGKSYYGLDKLCLNNLIQDNTMMKDFLVYQMMADFSVAAPRCSFVFLTVNGEDWGLYLAVEGVEDSFLSRSFGSDAGELYKPDTSSLGGGRGAGQDFRMDQRSPEPNSAASARPTYAAAPHAPGSEANPSPAGADAPQAPGSENRDVKLQYIDDDPNSYANIFDNAKTSADSAAQARLIASLKKLNAYSDLEDVLDQEQVLRYFVVHNFVCNGDSYTGSMVHNYYLYEHDGRLSMIPWDYNLAFGTFQAGNASDAVNASIDAPVSDGSVDDRPMLGWIFSSPAYTDAYHTLFSDFVERWFSGGALRSLISDTAALLRPYVVRDPTKFCSIEEFDAGVAALTQFTALRAQAVSQQLSGDDTAVDTGDLRLSDMGAMTHDAQAPGDNPLPDTQTQPEAMAPDAPDAAVSSGPPGRQGRRGAASDLSAPPDGQPAPITEGEPPLHPDGQASPDAAEPSGQRSLLGICAAVLILCCAFAYFFQRR